VRQRQQQATVRFASIVHHICATTISLMDGRSVCPLGNNKITITRPVRVGPYTSLLSDHFASAVNANRYSRYFTIDWEMPPPKISLHLGDPCLPPDTWLLAPSQVHTLNGTSTGSATFAGVTDVTNRQTHKPH